MTLLRLVVAMWLVLLLAVAGSTYLGVREHERTTTVVRRTERDERNFISNGIPTTTCLLEVFRNVQPLLIQNPAVARPLEAFLILQGHRYGEHRCPDRPGEAARLAQAIPSVR